MSKSKKILVGKIVAPQGIRGEVRIKTYTESPDDFKKLKIESDKFKAGDLKFIRRLNSVSDVIIAKIVGINDRNGAEELRGTDLFITADSLPAIKKNDEYYQADLIGMKVVRNGRKLGIVAGFQNFGGGDIIELTKGDYVSFVGAKVDMKNKKIYVR